jgi:hypothetical protein
MVHVAVHADRAAVHDAPDAGVRRGFDELPDRCRVDGPISVGRDARRPVDGREVIHDGDALDGFGERRIVPKVSLHHVDAGGSEVGGGRGVADQRPDGLCPRERSRQVAAREAGGSGD